MMNRHKLVFNNLFPFKHELLRKSRLENKSDFKLDSTKSDSNDLKKNDSIYSIGTASS